MPYFIHLAPDGEAIGTWRIDDAEAVRLGITNPQQGSNTYFRSENGLTAFEVMKRQVPMWFEGPETHNFVEMNLAPGEYYPRMARPTGYNISDSPGLSPISVNTSMIAMSRGQLSTLLRRLGDICGVVHPAGSNMFTFENEIRNLLILACTDVESQWRGILEINEYLKERFSTNDYVLLSPAMKLPDYTIEFGDYAWLPPFRPFNLWGSSGKPSQELPWFAAYNSTKHDREGQFHIATLEAAFNAVAACVVMACAQFGTHEALGFGELRHSVYPVEVPKWDASDTYLPPTEPPGDWRQRPFPFRPALNPGLRTTLS